MTINRLNEQIAFLRKQRKLTQEELAQAIGVSNQAVSKWESAQCCPDLQLLPLIASFFHVSIDELMGYQSAAAPEDLILCLRQTIDSLPEGEDFRCAFSAAAALHTILLSKYMTRESNGNPGWDTDDVIKHAANAEWGYSCCSVPEITTTMRHGSVFFSNNQNLHLHNAQIRRITTLLESFCDYQSFRTAVALYQLTVSSETTFATVSQICQQCELSEAAVENSLTRHLMPYLSEKEEKGQTSYRFDGMYMNLIPILSLLDCR